MCPQYIYFAARRIKWQTQSKCHNPNVLQAHGIRAHLRFVTLASSVLLARKSRERARRVLERQSVYSVRPGLGLVCVAKGT